MSPQLRKISFTKQELSELVDEHQYMKISFPKCEFCGGDENVHTCKNCDRWTCYECVKYPDSHTCIHKAYKPIQSWAWDENDIVSQMQSR